MQFNSIEFLLFFLAWAPLFYITKGMARMIVVLAGGLVFYGFWNWHYIGLIFFSIVLDFWFGLMIADNEKHAKTWMVLSIIANLGVLAVFKYNNFFIENVNAALDLIHLKPMPLLNILLPPGVSFYTFKSMSYTIDVYRKEIPVERNFIRYSAFITLFPELVAGPIVRASVLLPQLYEDQKVTREDVKEGLRLFGMGFVKKVCFADVLAVGLVDPIFANPSHFSTPEMALAVVGYSFQIYCDFAGYTDMAIGIGRLLGYRFPENFRFPYLANGFSDFWQRWHITLSTWLRDYLYIPLGGNRGSELQTYRNLMLTMLLGGFWHGASWNFVIWGFWHGALLAMERRWLKGKEISSFILIPFTFMVVTLLWIPFRAKTFGVMVEVFNRLFVHVTTVSSSLHPIHVTYFYPLLAMIGVVIHHVVGRFDLEDSIRRRLPIEAFVALSMCVVVGLLYLGSSVAGNSSPFIYFQF